MVCAIRKSKKMFGCVSRKGYCCFKVAVVGTRDLDTALWQIMDAVEAEILDKCTLNNELCQ